MHQYYTQDIPFFKEIFFIFPVPSPIGSYLHTACQWQAAAIS
jgi:hypothetical protein